jgi:hypothetical protein
MNNRFKMTVAAAALLAGTGFAYAQGTGMSHEGSSGGGAGMQQSAPSSDRGGAAERGGAAQQQMNHDTTQGGMQSSPSGDKSPAAGSKQRAEDSVKSDKSKNMNSENETKGGNKDMKAEGRQDQNGQKAEGREDRNGAMNAESKGADNKGAENKGADNKSQTVGQAGAGAKLSTEQRTKISSVIKNERVAPVTNVNFSVSVGTRIPHDVAFHPLPADVVTIYPEWRGYNFILVRDEIVVIDPSTFEIVEIIS